MDGFIQSNKRDAITRLEVKITVRNQVLVVTINECDETIFRDGIREVSNGFAGNILGSNLKFLVVSQSGLDFGSN